MRRQGSPQMGSAKLVLPRWVLLLDAKRATPLGLGHVWLLCFVFCWMRLAFVEFLWATEYLKTTCEVATGLWRSQLASSGLDAGGYVDP